MDFIKSVSKQHETLRNKVVNNHEREFPIPGIPGNIGLQFPSRKSGMEFSTPNPVPENGNGIFHSHSRSRKWEWNFMEFSFPFPLPGMEHQSREKYLFLGTSCISGKVKANILFNIKDGKSTLIDNIGTD